MSSLWNLFGTPEGETAAKPSLLWNVLGTGETIEAAAQPTPAPPEPPPCAVEFDEGRIFWAMQNLPVTEATKHFLICGATGSGKSVTIELFLKSIAKRFDSRRYAEMVDKEPDETKRPSPEQLIIFDAKYDAIPMLAGMGLTFDQPNVWLINPYDRRSAEWNLSEITRTPTMARHVATLLIPEEKNASGGSRYFTDAARELVLASIIALGNIAGDEWTLRDLLCALSSRDFIATVTKQHPRASQLAKRILDDDRHSPGVVSSIGAKLGQYEQIAALWHSQKPRRIFSIKEFLKKPGVLILGNDPVLRESLWPINAILLKSLTSEILRGEDTLHPRHWFVLDEFRAMERLDCMPDLLNRGRSKGASVLIGLQGIEGLEDTEVYGRAKTQEMLGQCGNKTFLRVGGPATAEWAQRLFGQSRYEEASRGESWSHGEHSHSVNYKVTDRSTFLASTFMNLPFPTVNDYYHSINDVPWLRSTIIVRRPFNQLLEWRKRLQTAAKAVEPRDNEDEQTLVPWNPDEEIFFCGKRLTKKSRKNEKSKESSTTARRKNEKKTKSEIKLPERDSAFPDETT